MNCLNQIPNRFSLSLVREVGPEYGDPLNCSTPEAVYRELGTVMRDFPCESLVVLMLTAKNRAIGSTVISTGDLSSSIVHPREVFTPAILARSAAILLVHNHPSGDPAPSQRDMELTKRIKDAGDLLGIKMLDHVIVATGGFYSFHNHGFFDI